MTSQPTHVKQHSSCLASQPQSHPPPSAFKMNTIPNQRPFFANFLAAFRAHSAIQQQQQQQQQQQSKSNSSSSQTPTTNSNNTGNSASPNSNSSHPRSIANTKTSTGATTSALTALHSPRPSHNLPSHTSTSQHSRPSSTSPPSSSQQSSGYMAANSNRRRGSDSSTEGFRETLGREKWYVGGRTAAGEERFFKLGVVRRERSLDRLSLDRLSL